MGVNIPRMYPKQHHYRSDLVRIATRAMVERGLEPEFSPRVEQQLSAITGPAQDSDAAIRDLILIRIRN